MHQIKQKTIKSPDGTKKIQNYIFKFSDFLGKGNFSSVYKGFNEMTNQVVAIKYISLSSLTCKRLVELLDQQIQIFTSLNHPNIVKCFEVLKSTNNCYIITQLCDGGDLQGVLNRKGILTQEEAIPYIKDIFEGLYYLSKKNIIHRDIKIANIFINNKKAKIADFGFAQRAKKQFVDGKIGTPLCMSPQGFLQNLYGCKTDVWAYGIILYQLTHGRIYLDKCISQEMLKENIRKQLRIQDLKAQLSLQLKDLIIRCLDINPCTRISFQEIRRHPFIQKICKNRLQPFSVQNLNQFETENPFYKSMNKISNMSTTEQSLKIVKTNKNDQQEIIFFKNKVTNNKQKENSRYGNKRIFQGKTLNKQQISQMNKLKPLSIHLKKDPSIRMKNIINQNTLQNQQIKNLNMDEQKNNFNNLNNQFNKQNVKQNRLIRCTSHKNNFEFNSSLTAILKKNNEKQNMNQKDQIQLNLQSTISTQGYSKVKEQLSHKHSKQIINGFLCKPKKMLNGFIRFNQAIGIIHFCRLLYKYIIELKIVSIYHQGNMNLKYYSNYLINILNQLDQKLKNGHIILYKASSQQQQQSKQQKITKMQKVIQQYIQRYKPNLQKQRADYLNKTSEQILKIIVNDKKLIEAFYIPDKTKVQNYNLKLIHFTQLLKKSTNSQKYTKFDSNMELEETMKQQNKQNRQRKVSIIENTFKIQHFIKQVNIQTLSKKII